MPTATYRLQLRPEFTFRDALAVLPYLQALGISDYYVSPLFQPRTGSTHGYDVVDYHTLNPALGSREELDALVTALQKRGMGLLLDHVPNHMGNGADNAWWMDVLANGPASRYADFFDIDWRPPKRELENKVLLPVLGDHYGRVLEAGDLRLEYQDGTFALHYGQSWWPVIVGTWTPILSACRDMLLNLTGDDHEAVLELDSLLTALRHLPHYADLAAERIRERQREQAVIQRRFGALHQAYPAVHRALAEALSLLNGNPDDRRSFDSLDRIINDQPYRLAFWRVAADEINYRRFFDINDMAAVRTEFEHVFETVHRLVFELLRQGKVTGLRIDHPDGLWDPPGYFLQLQEGHINALASEYASSPEAAAEAVGRIRSLFQQHDLIKTEWPLYIVAEKILSEIEPLPQDWAVYGTTGYDFMIAVNGIFVNRDHVHAFDDLYSRFIGQRFDFRELVYHNKKLIMRLSLASELNARAQQLARLVERNRCFRGFTLNGLTFALSEVVACLSIYRTYITGPGTVSERDRHYLMEAVEEAKRRNPRYPVAVFDFVRDTLLLDNIYDFDEADRGNLIEFVMQFQQITGPVMAKSVEDTTFYIYNRLVSLNEVGGNPEQFGIGLDDFHRHNLWHQEHWPHTMLALSTHDTKRGEDTRARINVLSELPSEWEAAIWRWTNLNASAKTEVDGQPAPDRNDEYLIYQTLVGVWPDDDGITPEFVERIVTYMDKATNEAKVHTSWVTANHDYDNAVRHFIERILADANFIRDFSAFQRRTAYYGIFNSLAQTLLKFTSPGVPDTYQGCEVWNFSLVDPDNRRPIAYPDLQRMLDNLQRCVQEDRAALLADLLQQPQDSHIKLYLTHTALNFRQQHQSLFQNGAYHPLPASGDKARHVCAFQRSFQDQAVIVVAPVLVIALTDGSARLPTGGEVWHNTRLLLDDEAGQQYHNILTGEHYTVQAEHGQTGLPMADVLGRFPVALLERLT
ncbi:MAG: malto-oligosyltrehalose synthase [Chloroflexi bacterium]|nr:malto-oligosyltrehalose synthase [Chloroflexota bacterium]